MDNIELQTAAAEGHRVTVEYLLSKGADINAEGRSGTALQRAAEGGYMAIVELLLSKGADINAEGEKNGTALQRAAAKGHTAIVELLLSKGANINAEGRDGTALQRAVEGGHTTKATVKLLISKGADINAEGGRGGTALHRAVARGPTATVKLLISKGADIKAEGKRSGTMLQKLEALQKAAEGSHAATVELLPFDKSSISPQSLQITLAAGRIEDVKTLLDKHFGSVAEGDFMWLKELREHGYETEEIVELLRTEHSDSPWIYFESRKLPRETIIPSHHGPFCVHTGGKEARHGIRPISSTKIIDLRDHGLSWTSDNDSLRYIEELCGIAGVAPNTRDFSKKFGSVKFIEEYSSLTASVSFRSDYNFGFEPDEIFVRFDGSYGLLEEHSHNILQALGNLCSAIANAQKSGICCDSFTVLQFQSTTSTREVIELRQIRVTAVSDLYSKFGAFISHLLVNDRGNIQNSMLDILACGESIFQQATVSSFSKTTFEGTLDCCSLAVQFLSLGFSSYIKAHVGALAPFFLDTSLQAIKLFGMEDLERVSPRITASLCRFTCLDAMIQNPVLVFREGPAEVQQTEGSYDLLASPEDLVDTWGPGQFVTTTGTQNLTAIMIGGGVIKPTAENSKVLHWSDDVEPRHNFSVHFSSTEKVLIAGGAGINTNCQANRSERWSSFLGSLQNLGTTGDYWKFTEFQAGVAITGQQFAGGQLQFNKTWTWHPGNSWKRQHLSLSSDELLFSELDRPWGLQVSACTGVARRVQLRLLLADTMPTFAKHLGLGDGWWKTLQTRGIINALEQDVQNYFEEWYEKLHSEPEIQILVKRLIRFILLVLSNTGIDRDQKAFLIACPQDHTPGSPISMCLPVPCENASLWAKILQDTEECATFAYMTNLCLESQEHKCQKTSPWHCPSLDTAVLQSRLQKDPITIPLTTWDLKGDTLYWIGTPDSGLQARVVISAGSLFPRLYISKSSIPRKFRRRILGLKMDRLREKQIGTWSAQDVLILSPSR